MRVEDAPPAGWYPDPEGGSASALVGRPRLDRSIPGAADRRVSSTTGQTVRLPSERADDAGGRRLRRAQVGQSAGRIPRRSSARCGMAAGSEAERAAEMFRAGGPRRRREHHAADLGVHEQDHPVDPDPVGDRDRPADRLGRVPDLRPGRACSSGSVTGSTTSPTTATAPPQCVVVASVVVRSRSCARNLLTPSATMRSSTSRSTSANLLM